MTVNLYQLLDIASNATSAEIKKAWKRKAQHLHSDKDGGDDAAFKAAKSAYEVLSDPESREHYDKTGKVRTAVLPLENEAREVLRGLFRQLLQQAVKRIGQLDVISELKKALDENSVRVSQQLTDVEQHLQLVEAAISKFHVDDDQENLFVTVLQSELDGLLKLQQQTQHRLAVTKLAAAILSHYSYDFQRALTGPTSHSFAGATGPGFYTWNCP